MTKVCRDCKKEKNLTEFHALRVKWFKPYCKLCSNIRSNKSNAKARAAAKLAKAAKFDPNILIAGQANVLFHSDKVA